MSSKKAGDKGTGKGKGKRVEFVGLDQLGTATRGMSFKIEIPELPKLGELPDTSSVEEMAEAVQKVEEGTANAFKYLASVRKQAEEYSSNRTKQRIFEAQCKKNVEAMRNFLEAVLTHSDDFFRRAAAITYIREALSSEFRGQDEAYATLRDLEEKNILFKSDRGQIVISYQRYDVNPKLGMEGEDIKAIVASVSAFSQRLHSFVHQEREQRVAVLLNQAKLSIEDVMAGKAGKCLLAIPAQRFKDPSGVTKWRSGGSLLVETNGKEIAPLNGIGGIEKTVENMAHLNIYIPRFMLSRAQPPTPQEVQKMASADLSRAELEDYFNATRVLFYMVRRALDLANLRRKFLNNSTIKPVQFFGLNGSAGQPVAGRTCLEFQGSFYQGTGVPSLTHLIVLVELTDDDQIELLDTPDHLKDALGEFLNKRFPVHNDFESCPPLLRKILTAIRGQVESAVAAKQ